MKTASHVLVWKRPSKVEWRIVTWTDAAQAKAITRWKSTVGYVITVSNIPLLWVAKTVTLPKSTVATSSKEAELYAAVEAVKETLWVHNMLCAIKPEAKTPLVWCDNEDLVKVANRLSDVVKYKHLMVLVQFLRDVVEKQLVCIKFVKGKHNLADPLTKIVPGPQMREFSRKLGLLNAEEAHEATDCLKQGVCRMDPMSSGVSVNRQASAR